MARKRFGQHFLHERGVIDRILHLLGPEYTDRLVEIGPGQGALTRPLLAQMGKLSVIEVDRDLIAYWQEQQEPGLEVIARDALKVDYAQLAQSRGGSLRLVGNLPYNISSPLLFALLQHADHIQDMHFMLQKEVVDRLVAPPGSQHYGRLSVAIAARAQTRFLFDVAPGAFTPPPRVMSAVVRLTPSTPEFTIENQGCFDQVVTTAFGQRRKTLRNTLKGLLNVDAIQACGVDPTDRPGEITPAEFACLANHLWAHGPAV